MIEAENLSKRYGAKVAVNGISFRVEPGTVTGFLGPNGAGKSTTMRMIVGLDAPTSGRVTVNGKSYADHAAPLHEVGALLEAKAVHTGRSARNHLRALAATHGMGDTRVDEVVEMTGLGAVASKRVGGFSLGMGQRLGIAAAMLGDPRTLILDEPVNGLDPEGVKWVRTMVRYLADDGRTVFLSSHLMSEMAITADHLIVIGRGSIITSGPVQDVIDATSGTSVTVRSPGASQLAELLAGAGVSITAAEPGVITVRGLDAATIGETAARNGVALHELTPVRASLEEAFMTLTAGEVEYHSGGTESATQDGAAA
ncbi:ABC transporter ATP-binding protein [Serinibacter arcticus]|uniref:ABC transporter, ATP-binding protein n=1 Tax=Serinibacter arcticus TaxID=1655435 RepID=A0A4Z1DX54_9MICO|nr:ABC transporter ATP-binding protein [Serinibacter arcticus]TGO04176.1 ABC transporter, ATP-binding protein [Serinibacter arcticus]